MNKENKCEELFNEYKKIEAVTHIEAQIIKRGEPYNVKTNRINPEDFVRLKEVAKELAENCEGYFKDKFAEWIEVQRDARI